MLLLRRALGDLLAALIFLTTLPVSRLAVAWGVEMRLPTSSVAAFPLVGTLLGGILVALDTAFNALSLPQSSRDIALVVALVILTGGLHLDGLMDSCDGLRGGRTPERRREIMRDSRVGSFGVLGGICVLLLKIALLGATSDGAGRVAALLVAPTLARWALPLAAVLSPPARPDGLGAVFRAGVTPPRLALAAACAILPALALAGGRGALAFLLASGATWLLGHRITASIGGLTGDSYGAIAEIVEIVALTALVL